MKNNNPEKAYHKTNNLDGQTSPYLLQHLYNPVNWYPWGEAALNKAMNEDKPIIVSIGYSACHWCHVMEKESFEDLEVAEIMNRDFVCIKVDREERPDIDHLYMTAVQLLTSHGGWPLNCFALPDTRPFWGGTYFPKEQWKSILTQIAGLYRSDKNDLVNQAEQITAGIADSGFIEMGHDTSGFNLSDGEHFFIKIMEFMDKKEGGTLRSPKFPLPVNHEFLLHYYYHSGNKEALAQVELSLDKMAMGGIFDQIGGGFARYSTDEIWKVPHFEKMLYDNAQLICVYSKAWKIVKKPLYRDIVYKTIEFISRELTSPDEAFFSALDADSEGEEGKFYVWKDPEIEEIVGSDAELVKAYYQVGAKGLWENGNNILLRNESDEAFSIKRNLSEEKLQSIIRNANQKLLKARSQRIRPSLDNKILTSWNALMIEGLVDASAAFEDNTFLSMAKRTADFINENAVNNEGKLYRSLGGKEHSIDGFLEDYAFFIQALIRLYETSIDMNYLLKAKSLTEYVMNNFSSPETNLFSFSSGQGEKLQAPFYEIHDNVMPSSNCVMAVNLLKLSNYFENPDWAARSFEMLKDVSSQFLNYSISFSNWGRLLLHHIYPFYTLVVSGSNALQEVKKITSIYLPGVLIAGSSTENAVLPVLKNRFKEGETWFYVCTMGRCNLPVNNLQKALEEIKKTRF